MSDMCRKCCYLPCACERIAKERAELPAREAEERRAWDQYAAAAVTHDYTGPPDTVTELAASIADMLLAERRKRFG